MASLLESKVLESKRYACLSADGSAALLAGKIRLRDPFLFLRYGDGALECMSGRGGMTCDGEEYSTAMGIALWDAWNDAVGKPGVYVGDWLSASFTSATESSRYAEQYAELVGKAQPKWLHFEALLLMRESSALVDFYRAVKEDSRRKLFMGPAGNRTAATMLGAEFLETPMKGLFSQSARLSRELMEREFDVLLYGAGMAGNIPVVECWKQFPERTYINLGSAMDALFRGRSRRQQLSPARARALFKELL